MRRTSLLTIAFVVLSVFAHAQALAPFMSLGTAQFFDNNGKPLTAGVLYSFQAGTTTQQATFTDSTGVTANPNPIPFGSGARVAIWLTAGNFYKFVLCLQNDGASCAPSDVLFSVDNVPGSPAGTFSGTFTGTFITSSANPATTGVLRLAAGDLICWRNGAGTANLCLSKTASDSIFLSSIFSALTFQSACAPSAATGTIRLCSTDTVAWRNAANTGDLPLIHDSFDNLVWMGHGIALGLSSTPLTTTNQTGVGSIVLQNSPTINTPAINGVTIASGAPLAGQSLVTTSPTNAAWTLPVVSQGHHSTTLSGNVSLTGGVSSTIMTQTVTMPAAGCPCRAIVSYYIYDTNNSGSGTTIDAWVTDGTSGWDTSQIELDASSRTGGLGSSAISENTYANSANITFTLKAQDSTGTTIDKLPGAGSPQNSWMTVDVIASN